MQIGENSDKTPLARATCRQRPAEVLLVIAFHPTAVQLAVAAATAAAAMATVTLAVAVVAAAALAVAAAVAAAAPEAVVME